jgi:hypothetical protein
MSYLSRYLGVYSGVYLGDYLGVPFPVSPRTWLLGELEDHHLRYVSRPSAV